MNVLSLFDGMSCGQIALENISLPVDNYYASEIDKYAMAVTKKNYPDTIHIGSVVDVDVSKLPKIDLLIGGSPCQGFSFSGKQKGAVTTDNIEVTTLKQYLDLKNKGFEFDGQSYLFWEYVRILEDIRKINPEVKFLLENVRMSKKWKDMFDATMGVKTIEINSKLVSAQSRLRYYWTNISDVSAPDDLGIDLYDIMETRVSSAAHTPFLIQDAVFENIKPKVKDTIIKYHDDIMNSDKDFFILPVTTDFSDSKVSIKKSITLRAGNNNLYLVDKPNKTYRRATVKECERLQTVPDDYTDATLDGKPISQTQRYRMLGNGWTVDVIAHILKNYNTVHVATINEIMGF